MSDQPSLFDALGPSPELKRRLQALALELMERMGDARDDTGTRIGVGFDSVRIAAETRGWLTGREQGRFLSCGDRLMRAAGGIVVGYRKSKHPNAHRRRIAVFVHRSFLPMEQAS